MQMITPWHEYFYHVAGEWVEQSWANWVEGNFLESWTNTFPARLSYLCDVVLDVVMIPFYLLELVFLSVSDLFKWNWTASKGCIENLMKKISHLFLSAFGAIFSPAVAYRYRDLNLAPYIIVGRIIVILGGLAYFAFRK